MSNVEVMSDISLESSRSSIGFNTARQSVGGSSVGSKGHHKVNRVGEYWNTTPLAVYSPPPTYTFFNGPQPPSIQGINSRVQLDPLQGELHHSNSNSFLSPPMPVKKQRLNKSKILKPLLSSTKEGRHEKKYELQHLSESQQVRLLKNVSDYVRFYAGHVNQLYRIEDVEYLIEHPVMIPINLTQEEKNAEGLMLTLHRQFQLGKIRPLNWFDIITGWKKGFKQIMTFEEFALGLNRYCDEKELPPWEEEDLEILFRYLLRSDEMILEENELFIRRHDFKIGFKKLQLSERRKVWLNHQGTIVRKLRHFLRVLRTPFRDFSVDYIRVQRQIRNKREQKKQQVSHGNHQNPTLVAVVTTNKYNTSYDDDNDDDYDDLSVNSNTSSQRGGLRRNARYPSKQPKQHAHFSDGTKPNLGEPGYIYTATKLQMSSNKWNGKSAKGNIDGKITSSSLTISSLARHCMTLPQLEATLSSILGDFLIFLKTKNRDRILREYFQKRDGTAPSSSSSVQSNSSTAFPPSAQSHHNYHNGYREGQNIMKLRGDDDDSSLDSISSLLHGTTLSDDDDNMSTSSLFSQQSLTQMPALVPPTGLELPEENPSNSAENSHPEDSHDTFASIADNDPDHYHEYHSYEHEREQLMSPGYHRNQDLVDDYYFSTESAAMAPSPPSPSQLSSSESRPDSSASAATNHSHGGIKQQNSHPRLSRKNSSKKILSRQASGLHASIPGALTRMNSAQLAAIATAAALGIAPQLPSAAMDGQQLLATVSLDSAKHHFSMVRRSHGLAPTRSQFQTNALAAGVIADDASSSSQFSIGMDVNAASETGKEHRERTRSILRSSLTARASLFQQYLQSAKSDARIAAASTSSKDNSSNAFAEEHASRKKTKSNSKTAASANEPPAEPPSDALTTFSAGMQAFQQKRLQQDDYRRLNDSFEKRVQFAVTKLHTCR